MCAAFAAYEVLSDSTVSAKGPVLTAIHELTSFRNDKYTTDMERYRLITLRIRVSARLTFLYRKA